MVESDPPLVDPCLQHMQCEADALRTLNQALLQVQEALSHNAVETLPARLARQQAAMETLEQIRVRRQAVRTLLAQHLGVPAQHASIFAWARGLPDADRHRVLAARAEVAVLAQETSRLAAINVAAVNQGIQVLREVMQCLTGSGDGDGRYSSQGDSVGLRLRPLVDARL